MNKFNTKQMFSRVTDAAKIGAGVLAANKVEEAAIKYLPEQVAPYSAAVPILAGALLYPSKKGIMQDIALGMMVGGVVNTAEEFIPGINGLGNLDQVLGYTEAYEDSALGDLDNDPFDEEF